LAGNWRSSAGTSGIFSHADLQIARKTAACIGQAPHLLHLHAQAAAEAVGLQTARNHDKLVLLEHFGASSHGFSSTEASITADLSSSVKMLSLPRWPLMVRRPPMMPAMVCGSRLSRISPIGAHEAAHFGLDLVEQMARQVEADGVFSSVSFP
jgi:hypothetical protein